jgi:hypothetical protein
MRLLKFFILSILFLSFSLNGCDSTSSTPTPVTTAAETATLPSGLFVSEDLKETKGVIEAHQSAKQGESILLEGYIGGRKDPFVDKRAMFVLADTKLPLCTDGCGAPWDACCETPETIIASTATVQILDDAGNLLKVGLENKERLKPSAQVKIQGIVAKKEEKSLVITAQKIYVLP